jgi:DNA-binding response OmpR family regulator
LLHEIIAFSAGVPVPPYSEFADLRDKEYTGARKVLVVDDERLIADTVTAILNEHGFEAVGVYNGEDAIQAARRFNPEILLTDVLMPKMSGIDLAIKFRAEFPEIPVLLFSGQAATSELMRKAAAEGHQFELLPKPIHPMELIAKLRGM